VPNEGRRHGASIPAGLTEALQEVETAGDVLNEMKRFSGKLSDRVLPLRVDGGAGIASGGPIRGVAHTHPAKSQHLCRTACAEAPLCRTLASLPAVNRSAAARDHASGVEVV
jgi:hypothetical protein